MIAVPLTILDLHPWSVAPFVLLLGAIALLPLAAHHWWESNRNKALVSAALAIPFAIWLVRTFGEEGSQVLQHFLVDYVAFLVLLGALYVIAGGIQVRGSLAGTPLSLTSMLGIGAVLANFVGTTGASVVLIRPLLRAVRTREARAHAVVFFIFIVSNCGGLLTPFADPPLFLGFLKGVPFEWTLGLWKQWVLVNGILLVIFFVIDSRILDREEARRPGSQLEDALRHEPVRIAGGHNCLFLGAVILITLGRGQGWGNDGKPWPFGPAEALMLGVAMLSWFTTNRRVHKANAFTFGPLNEVAILFAGIFVTMIAPLYLLNTHGPELGIRHPWQYFWATGSLSGLLDNAPTYLTFAATAAGQAGIAPEGSQYLGEFLKRGSEASLTLAAISCGAVFMGAMTYIGNGPNFMVKAIAEADGVKMPSFFGYMGWSLAILLPTFVAVTFVFFR